LRRDRDEAVERDDDEDDEEEDDVPDAEPRDAAELLLDDESDDAEDDDARDECDVVTDAPPLRPPPRLTELVALNSSLERRDALRDRVPASVLASSAAGPSAAAPSASSPWLEASSSSDAWLLVPRCSLLLPLPSSDDKLAER